MRALALVVLCAACGKEVAHGGVEDPSRRATTVTDAPDLLPADLDLVVRVDLARMRQSLDAGSAKELADEAFASAGPDGLVREALAKAEVAWLGVRLADLEAGDRVLVVESRAGAPAPDPIAWQRHEGGAIVRFSAKKEVERPGTAAIVLVGERQAAFVSPVEAQSVWRVLRAGPDPLRGQPSAEGLLSLDYRPRRLGASLSTRYPSLAGVLAGIERVQVVATLAGSELELDARIHGRGEHAAVKVERFLTTITELWRENETLAALLHKLRVERDERTVRVRWTLPPEALLALVREEPSESVTPP